VNYTQTDNDGPMHDSGQDGPDESVMPLGVGGFENEAADDLAEDQPGKRKFSSGTLVLGLVVLLAAGGLYSMRTLAIAMASAKGDDGLESTVNDWLDSVEGAEDDAPEHLVVGDGAILNDRTKLQVPLDDVKKNPFEFFMSDRGDAPVATDTSADEEAQRLREARAEAQRNCERAAEKLRVIMIMGGSDPMANVNGSIVRKGDVLYDDRLDVEFTVSKIEPGGVTVVAEDPAIDFRFEHTLYLIPNL